MKVKLHRCPNVWLKLGAHKCWRVQRELERAGIDYEVVKGPMRRSRRDDLQRLSGQRFYPVIEFENGAVYREESAAMAERIKSGKLLLVPGTAAAPAPTPAPGDTPVDER
jgi:glutathione S-transferase